VAGRALAELELASGRAILQLTLVIHHDGGGTELGWDAAHAIARMHDALQTASVRAKATAEHEVCIGQARV
jgi:YD repeat-containing protein